MHVATLLTDKYLRRHGIGQRLPLAELAVACISGHEPWVAHDSILGDIPSDEARSGRYSLPR